MEVFDKIAEKTKHCTAEKQKLYSVEEVFDRIDKKFIDFYGEYGRNLVNARRTEWNNKGTIHFKLF